MNFYTFPRIRECGGGDEFMIVNFVSTFICISLTLRNWNPYIVDLICSSGIIVFIKSDFKLGNLCFSFFQAIFLEKN